METNLEKDFKKWVLFNNQLSDFQRLYELYVSVESVKNIGNVVILIEGHGSNVTYLVSQEGYDSSLQLEGDDARLRFLSYLTQYYFPGSNIEEWYQSKLQDKEKAANIHIPSDEAGIAVSDFKVHPKEIRYYQLRVTFSVIGYLILLGVLVNSFVHSPVAGVVSILLLLVVVLFILGLRLVAQGLFVGLIKGASIKLNEHQYPEVFKIAKDQSKAIGLREVPEVYITYGHYNAFVTKLARKKYLVLHSEAVETAARGNYEILKFVIGHELGHIKRKHLTSETWLMPSLLIPFLKQAHARACEYTCDRIGHHFSKGGALEGILVMAAGKELYTKFNVNRYIEDADAENNFWVWLSEKFLSHPHTFKRMAAIRRYSELGY